MDLFARSVYSALHAERDLEHADESRAAVAAEATEGDVDRLVAAAEAARYAETGAW